MCGYAYVQMKIIKLKPLNKGAFFKSTIVAVNCNRKANIFV